MAGRPELALLRATLGQILRRAERVHRLLHLAHRRVRQSRGDGIHVHRRGGCVGHLQTALLAEAGQTFDHRGPSLAESRLTRAVDISPSFRGSSGAVDLLILRLGPEQVYKVVLAEDSGTAWRRLQVDMIIVHLRLDSGLCLLVTQMNRVICVSEAEVREARRPVSLIAKLGDALHVGNENVASLVEEADAVDGVRELDLAQEPLLEGPDLDVALDV